MIPRIAAPDRPVRVTFVYLDEPDGRRITLDDVAGALVMLGLIAVVLYGLPFLALAFGVTP